MSITNIICNGRNNACARSKRTFPLRGIVGNTKQKIRSAQRGFEQRDY